MTDRWQSVVIGDQAVDVVASEHVAYAVYARFSSSKYTKNRRDAKGQEGTSNSEGARGSEGARNQ